MTDRIPLHVHPDRDAPTSWGDQCREDDVGDGDLICHALCVGREGFPDWSDKCACGSCPLHRDEWQCEGYNVGGRWVSCDLGPIGPHDHGIVGDLIWADAQRDLPDWKGDPA